METEIPITNEDQLKVVKKLEEVLRILKHVPIKIKESLQHINKPLDDLLSSLKYLPMDPPFSLLPTEIKTNILGYLCNSGALVAASVCQEWLEILNPRLNELAEIKIGKHCTNEYECEDGACCLPEAMLKAITTLELDVPLIVCHPVTEVDPQVVSKGLASVSRLSLVGDCTDCVTNYFERKPILTNEQEEQVLVGLENRSKIMMLVELKAISLNNLDQDRLVDFLINKILVLKLDQSYYGPNLDIRKLVRKLNDSTDYKLYGLGLENVHYPDDLAEGVADALCRLPVVCLFPGFHLKTETRVRLIENILNRPTRTMSLHIRLNLNWRTIIEPNNLKTLVDKMESVELYGSFTPEQLEAARSCPGVSVNSDKIEGFNH